MNNEKIIEALKKKFKYIESTEKNVILSNYKTAGEKAIPEYIYNDECAYIIGDRGEEKNVSTFNSKELNALGILCLENHDNEIVKNRNNIISAKNEEEIRKIIIQYVTPEYYNKNIVVNSKEFQDNKINIIETSNGLDLYYSKGDKNILLTFLTQKNNYYYYEIARILLTKKQFDEMIVPLLKKLKVRFFLSQKSTSL